MTWTEDDFMWYFNDLCKKQQAITRAEISQREQELGRKLEEPESDKIGDDINTKFWKTHEPEMLRRFPGCPYEKMA